MKLSKKVIGNIIFFAVIIFILFTPYGVSIRAKLTQGVTYVKTLVIPPKADTAENRKEIDTNLPLKGIVNATDLNLSDLKGNVVFINYWATWCPPCRAEMPSIQSLYKDYSDKITFLLITSDNASKVENYFKNNDLNLPTYNLLSNPPAAINTRSIPATFVLDKQGNVALSEFGAANWNSSSVRELLDKLLAE